MKYSKEQVRQAKLEKIRRLGAKDLAYFNRYIFPFSIKDFKHGPYIDEISEFLMNQKTMRIGPRDHFKTTSLESHFMWKLLKARYTEEGLEGHYFSYKKKMAAYHVGSPRNEDNIKALVDRNPFFEGVVDEKDNAEELASYTWFPERKNPPRVTLTSHGLLEFTRGTHTKGVVYVDDPFQDEDPGSKLEPAKVLTINNRVMATVYSMPQYEAGAELHIVGTPQTEDDFFFNPKFASKFETKQQKAIVNEKEKVGLFPEFRSWAWLMDMKDSLPSSVWLQEYMIQPSYSTDTFLKEDELKKRIQPGLKNYTGDRDVLKCPEGHEFIAGLDIGKHRHPSHLTVFQVTQNNKYIQRVSFWMDNWDYTSQIEYIQRLHKRLKISVLYYDASRGEFESLQEKGKLPRFMKPVNLTNRKRRFDISRALAQKVEKDDILFVEDSRQFRQMLAVDNELHARETSEGHGDSFWSNACAMSAEYRPTARITII